MLWENLSSLLIGVINKVLVFTKTYFLLFVSTRVSSKSKLFKMKSDFMWVLGFPFVLLSFLFFCMVTIYIACKLCVYHYVTHPKYYSKQMKIGG
jgi:hypothetical protein